MTIKQNGGIFGRNPTFNNVTVEGEFTSSSLNIDSNKLYVDPNNVRVGINTDSPDTIFEIRGSDPILTIRDTDTGSATANATLRLAETGASDTLDSYWDIKATNGFLHFIDNWNEGGGTGTRISFLDGGGIAFNGDTAQANALDDYEEGVHTATLTPETSGTITLVSAVDTIAYTKIGRLVTVTGLLQITSVGSPVGGYVKLSLPFPISDITEYSERVGGAITYYNTTAYSVVPLVGLGGVSEVRVYVDASTLAANHTFNISFSYTTG